MKEEMAGELYRVRMKWEEMNGKEKLEQLKGDLEALEETVMKMVEGLRRHKHCEGEIVVPLNPEWESY